MIAWVGLAVVDVDRAIEIGSNDDLLGGSGR